MPKTAFEMYWVLATVWEAVMRSCGARERRLFYELMITTYNGITPEEHARDWVDGSWP